MKNLAFHISRFTHTSSRMQVSPTESRVPSRVNGRGGLSSTSLKLLARRKLVTGKVMRVKPYVSRRLLFPCSLGDRCNHDVTSAFATAQQSLPPILRAIILSSFSFLNNAGGFLWERYPTRGILLPSLLFLAFTFSIPTETGYPKGRCSCSWGCARFGELFCAGLLPHPFSTSYHRGLRAISPSHNIHTRAHL